MKINFEVKIQGEKVMVNFEGSVNELAEASKLQRTELAEWVKLLDDNKYTFERIINQYMDIGANLSKKMIDKQNEINAYQKGDEPESVNKVIEDNAIPWNEL